MILLWERAKLTLSPLLPITIYDKRMTKCHPLISISIFLLSSAAVGNHAAESLIELLGSRQGLDSKMHTVTPVMT